MLVNLAQRRYNALHKDVAPTKCPPRLLHEILRSYEEITAKVGHCSRTFCYPNGKTSDYTAQVREFCSRHFDAALSAEPGSIRSTELFELRRLAVDNATSVALLAKMLVRAEYE